MEDVIQIKQLYKTYKHSTVLSDLSFSIQSGEIFGLLGPSGSGKTTLVKLLVGIERASSGNINVLNHLMPSRNVSSEIGYMGQSDALYEDLTGYENMMFFASLYGIYNEAARKRIHDLFNRLDLTSALHQKVNQYSGGMKKRLSLAIAIIHKPKILILDEPTVGIDPVLRKNIWQQFYEFRNEGTTIIVTTHIMEEIEKCDRALLLREGQIIAFDTLPNLKNRTSSGKIEELFFTGGQQ